MVEVELREWGHSIGLIVPAKKIREMGLKTGDRVDVDILKKKKIDAFGIFKGAKPFVEDTEHEDIWRKK